MTESFGCPQCKSDNVSELNSVDVLIPVTEWDKDGEPVDFGSWKIVDGTITVKQDVCLQLENEPRYHCDNCNHEFELPVRLKKE